MAAARHDDYRPGEPRREDLWKELSRIADKATKSGHQSLSDRDVADLGRLYRAAASHLNLLRVTGASQVQLRSLNRVVARAHNIIYGRAQRGINLKGFFFSFLTFPATIRQTIGCHALAAAILILGTVYGYFGASADPDFALEFSMGGDSRTPYATKSELLSTLLEGRPESMGGSGEHGAGKKTAFAAMLWKHNTSVALLAFFSGFLFGLPTVLLLFFNGTMLGVYTYTFASRDLSYEWWAWILPHGVTELLAIVLLSGGGLVVAKQQLFPGGVRRSEALSRIRGHGIRLLLFAFPMFLVAAVFESFVRQSGLSDGERYTFAAGTAIFWLLYLRYGGASISTVEEWEKNKTIAERVVRLPIAEELLLDAQRKR
ncbi:MAG: stage II sporulation protein M [Planctomycetota bacterium]